MEIPTNIIHKGQRFTYLTVIERAGSDTYGNKMWKCQCKCGSEAVVRGGNLKSGAVRSCGCLAKANALKHGESRTRLYRIWHGIIRRTEDPTRREYKNYGARGVRMCEEWRENFESFRDWARENGYTDDRSIIRVDKNGDYTPSNCSCSE